MAESDLSVSRSELLRHVGRFLGYGSDSTAWSSSQTTDVNDAINRGLRAFYQPPALEGEKSSHSWSFMQPILRASVGAGVSEYRLPDDFGGFLELTLHFAQEDEVQFDIPIVGLGQILSNRQLDSGTNSGVPELAAIEPIQSDGTDGQRFSLHLWPETDSTYTLTAPYYSNPYQISSTKPYPLGGQPHALTLIESCLASAELMFNDERGVHSAEFMTRLRSSVSHDRRAMGPKSLGYNGDRSSAPVFDRRSSQLATYNGQYYLD